MSNESSPLDLKNFYRTIELWSKTRAGYPGNLDYDYTPLWPFLNHTINNAGDPYIEPNFKNHSKQYERECLAWFARLYELEKEWGYIATGGTEGNFYGITLGRELYPDAILYYSRDSHYSVGKAVRLFKIPHVAIDSQPNGEIDYEHLEKELSRQKHRSAIVNLNLGTTMKGAVDKIEPVVDMLERLNIDFHIHCDGALGGMLIPFIQEAPKISFDAYPIGSIAVSGHKFIGSPIPCGIVLTREEYVNKIAPNIEYIGGKDTTILGSRSGFTPLVLWYAIQTRSHKFADEVSTCLENARYLRDRLTEIGYHPLLNDFSNTVVFEKPSAEVCQKWQLATEKDLAHVVVMQNITSQKIDDLIDDLLKES